MPCWKVFLCCERGNRILQLDGIVMGQAVKQKLACLLRGLPVLSSRMFLESGRRYRLGMSVLVKRGSLNSDGELGCHDRTAHRTRPSPSWSERFGAKTVLASFVRACFSTLAASRTMTEYGETYRTATVCGVVVIFYLHSTALLQWQESINHFILLCSVVSLT